jgi:hypothetical protein
LVFLLPKGKGSQFLEIGGNWSKGCCPVISGMNNRRSLMQTNEGRRKINLQILSYSFSVVLQNYFTELQDGKRLNVLPNVVTFHLCVCAYG